MVAQGLGGGNFALRAVAAEIAGLLGQEGLLGDRADLIELALSKMLQDRSAELSGPAARALARLDNRDAIPTLQGMIMENNDLKGEAAVFALSRLGGPGIVDQMKLTLETATRLPRYRVIRVLCELRDRTGMELLREETMDIPALAPEAALILARDRDWEAMQFLRQRLTGRFDKTEKLLLNRGKAAAALIAGGDPVAMSVLQELLRSEDMPSVQTSVCDLIANLGDRRLLPITQSAIESMNPLVALAGCQAAVATADEDFRRRLRESQL